MLALLRYSEPSRHTGGTHRVADSALQDCTRCCRLIANSSTKISSHSPACAFNEPTTKALTCRGCCTHTHAATALRRVAPPHASPPPPPLTAHSFTHAPADAPAAAISRGTTIPLYHTRPAAAPPLTALFLTQAPHAPVAAISRGTTSSHHSAPTHPGLRRRSYIVLQHDAPLLPDRQR